MRYFELGKNVRVNYNDTVRWSLYLNGVGDVPRGLPFVDLVPAASELATAAGRVLVEATVVHAERLRRPLGEPAAVRVADTGAFFHAAVRRQFRIARGPERVRVRLAAAGRLQSAPLGQLRAVCSSSRRRGRLVSAATFHDGLHARAVFGHVRLDRGPDHVHGGAERRNVKPAEIGHRPAAITCGYARVQRAAIKATRFCAGE